MKKKIKETPCHCVFSCTKVQGIYDHIVRSLHLDNIIPLPTTPKHSLIWDADCQAPNLANAVWTLILNEILVNQMFIEKLDFERSQKKLKVRLLLALQRTLIKTYLEKLESWG